MISSPSLAPSRAKERTSLPISTLAPFQLPHFRNYLSWYGASTLKRMMAGDSLTTRDEAIIAFSEKGGPGERLKGVKEQILREL
jgi:hypothetical protein